jgi:DNA (cytosine-5)-methyltransferase 1
MTRTFYEFFCGGGMARAGLGAGWECAFANDIDVVKARSYAANLGHEGLIIGDVANLTTADLPGRADLAHASPPCQDVSLAGDRAGLDGARSGAFWPFMNLMLGLRAEGRAPRMIGIENVTGLITSHDGQDIDAICSALTGSGYRYGAVVIDAALFVPQSRKRVFIIGVDQAIDIPAAIIADRPRLPFHPPAIVTALRRQRAQPIWFRLPVPPMHNMVFSDLVEDIPTGVPWHPRAETDRLIGMMAPRHVAKLEAAKRAGKRMIGAYFKRMR